jgi:hypothetical protein
MFASNATNIRMIEEMGISPGRTFRNKRPTLKTVAQAVVFCLRAKKASAMWADSRRVQDALIRKMEAVKAVRARGRKPVLR